MWDINDCVDYSCVHGECFDETNGYRCECETGYEGFHCDTSIKKIEILMILCGLKIIPLPNQIYIFFKCTVKIARFFYFLKFSKMLPLNICLVKIKKQNWNQKSNALAKQFVHCGCFYNLNMQNSQNCTKFSFDKIKNFYGLQLHRNLVHKITKGFKN